MVLARQLDISKLLFGFLLFILNLLIIIIIIIIMGAACDLSRHRPTVFDGTTTTIRFVVPSSIWLSRMPFSAFCLHSPMTPTTVVRPKLVHITTVKHPHAVTIALYLPLSLSVCDAGVIRAVVPDCVLCSRRDTVTPISRVSAIWSVVSNL